MTTCLRLLVASWKNQMILLGSRASRLPTVQSVRFRKPRWVPIAKSKEFYVRKPTPIIQEEYIELKSRYRLYRAEVESIREFLRTSLSEEVKLSSLKQSTDNLDTLDVMREEVCQWNTSVSLLRNERQAHEELEEEQRFHSLMERHAQDEMARVTEAKLALLRNQAASVDFIQPDNLDEAIETLLDSRSDYNFAITKSGDVLSGEHPDRPENWRTKS